LKEEHYQFQWQKKKQHVLITKDGKTIIPDYIFYLTDLRDTYPADFLFPVPLVDTHAENYRKLIATHYIVYLSK
jgi:hypothetical protein